MNHTPSPAEVLFRAPKRRACMELHLVLTAARIPSDVRHRQGEWQLIVPASHAATAAAELESYHRDNAEHEHELTSRVPLFAGAFWGLLGYITVLVTFDVADKTNYGGMLWDQLGQMQAGQVREGQWWRVFTALTLHADAQHLLSNLAFGGVFGLLAGRILGGGVAWFFILISGAAGNLLNGTLRAAEHTSIGASTAVFAALGILVAHALRPRSSWVERPMKRWSPLIGGVVMLAMMGVEGDRTDVGAHVTGFISGVALGWFGCRVPDRWLANRRLQQASAVLAVTLLLIAWGTAVAQR